MSVKKMNSLIKLSPLATALALAVSPFSAFADEPNDPIVVDTLDPGYDDAYEGEDDGMTSLQEAFCKAAEQEGPDTILFDSSLSGGTITPDEYIRVGSDKKCYKKSSKSSKSVTEGYEEKLVVDGESNNITIELGKKMDGEYANLVVPNGNDLTLKNLTISVVETTESLSAVYVDEGTLSTDNMTFVGNAESGDDDNVIGILAYGSTLSIKDTNISGFNTEGEGSGVFSIFSDLLIRDSEFSYNSTPAVAVVTENETAVVTNSTFTNNNSTMSSSKYSVLGGGLAFLAVNSGDEGGTIKVDSSTFTDNTSGIGGGISIVGLDPSSLSGFSFSRLPLSKSEEGEGTDITLENLTVSDNEAYIGGGISVLGLGGGKLHVNITDSTITNNSASFDTSEGEGSVSMPAGSGGGLSISSAKYSDVDVIVESSEISNNKSQLFGGGISVSAIGFSGGGEYSAWVDLDVYDSSIVGNSTNVGGGGVAIAALEAEGGDGVRADVTFNRSTIANNTAVYMRDLEEYPLESNMELSDYAKGIGGGIMSFTSSEDEEAGGYTNLELNNTTLTGNQAAVGGGGITVGVSIDQVQVNTENAAIKVYEESVGYEEGSSLSMMNSTVAGNTAYAVGGIVAYISGTEDESFIGNSIIAGNTTTTTEKSEGFYLPDDFFIGENTEGIDVAFTLVGEYNEDAEDLLMDEEDQNILGADPLLGGLDDNGGETQTICLQSGSPAIDAGSNELVEEAELETDQTGAGRIDDVTGIVDLGPLESSADNVCSEPPPPPAPVVEPAPEDKSGGIFGSVGFAGLISLAGVLGIRRRRK